MLKTYFKAQTLEAGCDEAGRGCLAGPVVAAAVILPQGFCPPGLNDSKQIDAALRAELRTIIEQTALAWAVAFVGPQEIDRINILQASFLAMHQAVQKLATPPELLLIDGNRFKPYPGIAHECIIKGDAHYASIAAASVLAKTYRDDYMHEQAQKYPGYGWHTNVGYPTPAHRKAIKALGPTPLHRRSFKWQPVQKEIFKENESQG